MHKFFRDFLMSVIFLAFWFALYQVGQSVKAAGVWSISVVHTGVVTYTGTLFTGRVQFSGALALSWDLAKIYISTGSDSWNVGSYTANITLDNATAWGSPWEPIINFSTGFETYTGTSLYLHVFLTSSTGTNTWYLMQTITFIPNTWGGGLSDAEWAAIYTGTIASAVSAAGINSNLSGVTAANVGSFSWLRFEKPWSGKIELQTGLNLKDSGVQWFLQNIPTFISIDNGLVMFNPTGSGADLNVNAQITMYFATGSDIALDSTGFIEQYSGNANMIVATDSGGNIMEQTWTFILSMIQAQCEVMWPCELIFNTPHFTEFDIKPYLTAVHIVSSNTNTAYAKSGDTVILTFTGSETLSWVIVSINGQSVSPSGWGTARTATFNVTWWTVSGVITYAINYFDVYNHSWATVTGTTDTTTVTVDSIAPLAPVISTTWSTVATTTTLLTGTAETWARVDIYSWATFITSGTSTGTFSISVPLISWANTFQAYATDLAWNMSTESNSVTTIRDTSALTGSFTILTSSPTSGTTVSLSLQSQSWVTYTISWDISPNNLTWTMTWTTITRNVILTAGDGVKTIYIQYSWITQSTLYSNTITLDQTAPSVTLSTASWLQFTWSTITITWTGNDTGSDLANVYVNGLLASWTTDWSRTLTWLAAWVTALTITWTDNAGNTVVVTGSIRRIVNIPTGISVAILSWTSVTVSFTTDLAATGYLAYGTSSLDTLTGSASWTTHTITLDDLSAATTYYYRTYGINGWYTWAMSATWTFITPSTTDTVATGAWTYTWDTFLSWSTSDWFTSTVTGTLQINSGSNSVSLDLSWLVIDASWGAWDGVILPPDVISFSGNAPSETNYTHVPGLSFLMGSDTVELILWQVATVNLYVGTTYNDKTMHVYRSIDNGTTYTHLATCTVSAGVCSFTTDHFSLFSLMQQNTTTSAGWGGSSSMSKDNCPDGDTSLSYYDGICEPSKTITKKLFGEVLWIWDMPWSLVWSPFTTELNNAYLYAYNLGIVSSPSILWANMEGTLIRAHMAKMIVNYTIKVMWLKPDTTKTCNFGDIGNQSSDLQVYIKLSCQLGLMWIGVNSFDPEATITRAQFGTVLSRTLFGDKYNNGKLYYTDHLQALKDAGIMNDIGNPEWKKEIRWYVLLMMMRADK